MRTCRHTKYAHNECDVSGDLRQKHAYNECVMSVCRFICLPVCVLLFKSYVSLLKKWTMKTFYLYAGLIVSLLNAGKNQRTDQIEINNQTSQNGSLFETQSVSHLSNLYEMQSNSSFCSEHVLNGKWNLFCVSFSLNIYFIVKSVWKVKGNRPRPLSISVAEVDKIFDTWIIHKIKPLVRIAWSKFRCSDVNTFVVYISFHNHEQILPFLQLGLHDNVSWFNLHVYGTTSIYWFGFVPKKIIMRTV